MITEGHLVRHFQGRRGGRGPAIIDIAQDHVLHLLAREGLFKAVSRRFAFLRDLTDEEFRWAHRSKGDDWEVRQAIAGLALRSQRE